MPKRNAKSQKHIKRTLHFSVSGALLAGGLVLGGCAATPTVNPVPAPQGEPQPGEEPSSRPADTKPPARKIINTRPPVSDEEPGDEGPTREPTPDEPPSPTPED